MAITYAALDSPPTSVRATCTAPTGTEAAPASAGDGLNIFGLHAISIHLASANGSAFLPGGRLDCYLFEPYAGTWSRCPDLDLTVNVSGLTAVSFPASDVEVHTGRVAFIPNGLGVPSTVTIIGGH